MDVQKILIELRQEREQIDQSILSFVGLSHLRTAERN